MNTVCLSENAHTILKTALAGKGYELIEIRKTDAVYSAVSSHGDIYLCKIGDGIVVAPEQLPLIRDMLLRCGVRFTPGASALGGRYPENVKYNAAQVGRFLIHRIHSTDPVVLEKAGEHGLEPVSVRQGYTKCSLVIVDDRSVITSDAGLARSLKQLGIDVLPVSVGHVKLPGFPYGFLGGASGRLGEEVIFNGDLSAHPDFLRIKEFIERRGLRVTWFPEYPLEDIGSIIQL